MAAVRRLMWQLSGIGGFGASKSRVSSSSFQRATFFDPFPVSGTRNYSQLVKSNGKHLFFVDTWALFKRLEGEGVPSKQAEAITKVLNDSLENVSQSLVSKGEMQKIEMMQEFNMSKFKAEVQSAQGHHFSLLQHETEKLRNDTAKMCSELRKISEKLSKQIDEVNNLINKLDREIHSLGGRLEAASLRAELEAAKYDFKIFCIGTLLSIFVVGLAVLHNLM